MWEVIGESSAAHVLCSINDTNKYILATRYFCGCLRLIVRGLSVEQLSAIGRASMLPFIASLLKSDQLVITEALEAEWDWAEEHTIQKLKAYAKAWFETPAGAKYKTEYEHDLYVTCYPHAISCNL